VWAPCRGMWDAGIVVWCGGCVSKLEVSGGKRGRGLCVLLVNTAYFGEILWSGVGGDLALALPLAVVEAGILVVHAQYLVTDELNAMLREGAGLQKTRRILP